MSKIETAFAYAIVGTILIGVGQCSYQEIQDSPTMTTTIREDIQEAYPKCLIVDRLSNVDSDSAETYAVVCGGNMTWVRLKPSTQGDMESDEQTINRLKPQCRYIEPDGSRPLLHYILCDGTMKSVTGRRPLDKTIITETGR